MPARLYTIQEAAKKIGVSPDTLRRWDKKGILSPKRTPGGQRRYSEIQIESFLAKNNESSVTPEPSTAKAPTKTLNGYAQFLTIQEAATVLGISAKTLRRWDAKGVLSPIRTPGGQRRYSNEQLQNVLGKKEEPKSEPAQSEAQTTTPGVPQTLAEAIEPEPFEPLIPGPLFIERLAMLKHKTLLTKENIAANLNDALSKIPEGVKLFTVLAFLITGLFIGASFLVQNTDKLKGTISEPLLTMLGKRPSEEVLARQERTKAVLAAETNRLQLTGTLSFNLPATFNETVTAPNIVYAVTGGTGITVAGGQTPTITNTDPGSSQNIFGNIKLGSDTATAGSNTDTFEFAAGSNVSLSLDKTNKKLTITSSDANSGGDITAVNIGNGFSGGGSSGSVTIDLDITTTSTSTTTTANSGLETASSGLSLLRGCSDSQVLQWDATNVYWECAAATSTFTLAGDSGTSQTISGGDTMTVAGGTNGIDTVASSTDTITLNFDATEVGTTTWGSGSAFTWTFDAGSSDPLIAFTSNQMSFGAAVQSTITAHTVFDSPAITATSGQNFYKMLIDNNAAVTVAGSPTTYASLAIDEPNISGTVTNAATLYLFGAPTEGSSGNFAVWVDNGESRFENTPVIGSTTGSALTVVPAYVVEDTNLTLSGIRVALDTNSNTDAGDIAYGVNIDDITTSSGPTEYGLRIGSGYDYTMYFELGTRDLRIAVTAPSAGTSPLTATIPAVGSLGDTFCMVTLGNCFGSGSGGSGATYTSPTTAGLIPKFTATTGEIQGSNLSDDGTTVTIAANASLALADGTGSITQTYSPAGATSTARAFTITPKFTLDVTNQALQGIYINPNTNLNNDSGDTLAGINIDTITGSDALESAVKFGAGWDNQIYFTDTTTILKIANGGSILIEDDANGEGGDGNDICTISDGGNLSCTGTITGGSSGTQGYWDRTSTTLSPATANDIVSIANNNTTGADFAITNTGVYTGTGVANITANSLTTGVAQAVSTTGLTTGSSVRVTGSGTTMQTGGELVDLVLGANTVGAGMTITSTGVYTGTGSADGLINVVANSLTTGLGSQYSFTGLTTGSGMKMTGSGATMQTGGELIDLALGANTVGAGITVTSTGAYTGTGSADGLINVVANSLTTGLGSQYSFTGLTTGSGMKMTGSGATMQTGGELIDLALGANTVGAGITITSTGAYTGTGAGDGLINVTANSLTTGYGSQFIYNGISTGRGINVTSTSTAYTTGNLIALDWTPGSATTATSGDLFKITIGANGTLSTGNLFNIVDGSSSLFSVSETQMTSALPANFTAAGDVSIAYDIVFTNPTASYIKSQAPLQLVSGETFNSSNLTLQTYNAGSVVISPATGTSTSTTGLLRVDGTSATDSYASAYVNTTYNTSTASTTAYGIYNAFTNSNTTNADTVIGAYTTITDATTLANTLVAFDAATTMTGVMTTGTRNVYGLRSQPTAGAESTGGTTNVYGVYSKATGDVATGGTINTYGLYVADGGGDAAGTAINFGLYLEPITGAGENIGICFDCDTTFGTSTVATGIRWGNEITTTQNLEIFRSNGAAAAQITIQDEAGTDILNGSTADFQINLGAQVAATAQRLCHNGLDAATGVQSIGDCDPTNADLAEWYSVTDNANEGDVVSIAAESSEIDYYAGKTTTGFVQKSQGAYDSEILGVISTSPSGEVLGEAAKDKLPNPKAVALVGRVPIKVSTENGPIVAGDYLTSSTTPGVAMRADKPGRVIGKAIQSYSGTGIGRIVVFVNVSFADPNGMLASLVIGPNGNVTSTQSTTGTTGTTGGNVLGANTASASATLSNASNPSNTSTPSAAFDLASDPLFASLQSDVASLSAKIALLQDSIVASASTSAFLQSATTSAMLTPSVDLSTSMNEATISGRLTVLGRTTLTDLGVTGDITAGVTTIKGLDGEINTLAGPLRLQGLALQGIEMVAGNVKIDTKGNIIAKSITVEEVKIVAGKTTGSGTITAGTKTVDIDSIYVAANSRIFVTATTQTGVPLAVIAKKPGQKFTVSIPTPTAAPITFDWWIVNEQ